MAHSFKQNPENQLAPRENVPETLPGKQSSWASIFPSAPQQTAFMLFWGVVVAGMVVWMMTARGPQLIDINHAEFRETRFMVDINSAGPHEFSCLPGIGKKTAASIVNYRNQNGPFQSVESMAEVPGVSERLLNSLKDFLSIPAAKELADDH